MKKIIFILVTIVLAVSTTAQSGHIRISFAGFDCYRETWDDILNSDGKGDEVFLNFGLTVADKNGNSKLSYEKRTMVYGDATRPAFSNRVNVGSCVDLFGNNRGGIKAGDTYRCNDIVGEYDLADGDIVTVVPTIWEYDPNADNSNSFFSTMSAAYASISKALAPKLIVLHFLTGDLTSLIYGAASLGVSKTRAGGDQGELGKAGTRPIGMEKYGDFSPKLIALNTPNLSMICNSDMGFGKGIIAVNYDETAVGNLRDHGIYTILLKVEFIPNPNTTVASNNNTPAPAPAPSNKNITTKNVATTTSSNSIAGIWKGTYGNGDANSPNFYSFQLNADGTMQLLDAANRSIGSGTYKFESNQFTAVYKYSGGQQGFLVSGTMDAAGRLNGTWSAGLNSGNAGKWVMSKGGTSIGIGNIR